MNFKRLLFLMVVLLAVLIVFAGCSGKSEEVEAEVVIVDENFYEVTEPIEIEWWHALESHYNELIVEVIDRFNATGTKVTVIPVYQGSYSDLNEKLIAGQAAGMLPALTVANTPYVAEYGNSGVCEILDPYIEATNFDINDFGEGLIKASSFDNEQISLPFLISTQIMYYNVGMQEAENIKLPDTWDEMDGFMTAASKISGGETQRYATSFPGWDHWYFETFFLNRGVEIITVDNVTDLNSDLSVETASAMQRWVAEGKATWPYGPDGSTNMRQSFFDGKNFSVIHTSSLYNMYVDNCDFEIGMHYLPGDKTRNSEIGGSIILIPAKNSQEVKNAAWEFLQFVTSKDVNMLWAERTGYMPTRNSVLSTEEAEVFLEEKPAFQTIFDHLDNIYPRIQNPAISQVVLTWRETMAKTIIEGGDMQVALDEAKVLIDEALAEY